MPELPEVESARRLFESTLAGRVVAEAHACDDEIVFGSQPAQALADAVRGQRVARAGRRGKLCWLEFDGGERLYLHLGMSGWVRRLGASSERRLVSHGAAPLDDTDGTPRFLKLLLVSSEAERLAFTDGRRLGRAWLGDADDPRLARIGPDAWLEPWSPDALAGKLQGRRPAIKAMLLDQALFAGVGNWIADEALFHAGIAPMRPAGSLTLGEIDALLGALGCVLDTAIEADADPERYPDDWLFRHRWGGGRGPERIGEWSLRRDQVGGRTTAWSPDRQR